MANKFIGINLLGPYSLIPRYGKTHEALNESHQKSYLDSAILQAVIVLTVIDLNGPLVTTGKSNGRVTLRDLKVLMSHK